VDHVNSWRSRREVNGIADFSLGQVIGNLFGNGDGHVDWASLVEAPRWGVRLHSQGDEFCSWSVLHQKSSAARRPFGDDGIVKILFMTIRHGRVDNIDAFSSWQRHLIDDVFLFLSHGGMDGDEVSFSTVRQMTDDTIFRRFGEIKG